MTSTQRRHWLWLGAAFPFAFLVPFVFADVLDLNRDLFYGLYAVAVGCFVALWARSTALTRRAVTHHWRWGIALGLAVAGLMASMVVRTEPASDGPGSVGLVAAVFWRGVLYGATDAVLLSVFPILAVFGAFAGTRARTRIPGVLAIGAVAMAASIGLTATYHLGYTDFRSEKVQKPIAGDVIWSAPTLVTLSPLGAPIAHIGLHVGAVVHNYDTGLFLPPH